MSSLSSEVLCVAETAKSSTSASQTRIIPETARTISSTSSTFDQEKSTEKSQKTLENSQMSEDSSPLFAATSPPPSMQPIFKTPGSPVRFASVSNTQQSTKDLTIKESNSETEVMEIDQSTENVLVKKSNSKKETLEVEKPIENTPAKKSKIAKNPFDDDEDDLFNFIEEENDENTQRKRKRSEAEINPKPLKKAKSTPAKEPLKEKSAPKTTNVIKELENPKPKKIDKSNDEIRVIGFLSKSQVLASKSSVTATTIKTELPDVPEEELSKSFMVLEVRSLVKKKEISSNNSTQNSFQSNTGDFKNVKRFRKQSLVKSNQTVVSCTATQSPLNITRKGIFEKPQEPDEVMDENEIVQVSRNSRVDPAKSKKQEIDDFWNFESQEEDSSSSRRKRKR